MLINKTFTKCVTGLNLSTKICSLDSSHPPSSSKLAHTPSSQLSSSSTTSRNGTGTSLPFPIAGSAIAQGIIPNSYSLESPPFQALRL
jgi:hypothetical protein